MKKLPRSGLVHLTSICIVYLKLEGKYKIVQSSLSALIHKYGDVFLSGHSV